MARRLLIGVGAVGALSAAATGVYLAGRTKPPETEFPLEAAADGVCITSNVRLVEGMAGKCLTAAQYEALRDRRVIGAGGAAVEVNLTAPSDENETAVARSCIDYDELIAKGWYARTGADMRREDYFRRACGSLSMLAKARVAQTTNFKDGRAGVGDIQSMADEETFAFGEAAPSASANVVEVEDRVWRISVGAGETTVYEIAHADFTGDGLGEILAYVSIGAAGGTARTGTIGLIEKSSADGPCGFTAR